LRQATRLPDGEGYYLRRPWRAYGTRTMVETIFHVIGAVRERFPDTHVLAYRRLVCKGRRAESASTARINPVATST
jgi:hypothetical protein